MVREHRYIEAYCYIKAIIKCRSRRLNLGSIRNNFLSTFKVSKLLGMAECVFAKVTHLNKITSKAVTALGFKFGVE